MTIHIHQHFNDLRLHDTFLYNYDFEVRFKNKGFSLEYVLWKYAFKNDKNILKIETLNPNYMQAKGETFVCTQ